MDDRPKQLAAAQYVTLNWSAGAENIPSRLGPQTPTYLDLPQDIGINCSILKLIARTSTVEFDLIVHFLLTRECENLSLTLSPNDSSLLWWGNYRLDDHIRNFLQFQGKMITVYTRKSKR